MSSRRGVALVLVLALLVALGTIAATVGRAVKLERDTAASLRARSIARYAAESGIIAAQWRLQAVLDSAPSLTERAAVFSQGDAGLAQLADVRLGGARFGVSVADLGARLDLNRSDPAALRNLFAEFTSSGRAGEIVAAIRQRPLYRLAELAAVPGVAPALAAAVAPYVTVWGDGAVNINSAPERVLAALPSLGDAGARSVMMRRGNGEILTSGETTRPGAEMFAPPSELEGDPETGEPAETGTPAPVYGPLVSSGAIIVSPSRLLIISRGWQIGHPLTHEVQAVYAVMGARLALQAWQERDL